MWEGGLIVAMEHNILNLFCFLYRSDVVDSSQRTALNSRDRFRRKLFHLTASQTFFSDASSLVRSLVLSFVLSLPRYFRSRRRHAVCFHQSQAIARDIFAWPTNDRNEIGNV